MIRFFAIVLGLGFAALLGGFLYLGAAPPKPHVQNVQIVLPNSRFAPPPLPSPPVASPPVASPPVAGPPVASSPAAPPPPAGR